MESKKITREYIASFFKLSDADAAQIFARLQRKEYSNADNIVTAGDPADGMYFIDDGKVDVISKDGNVVNEMQEGQYFGEYAIIAEEPRMTTVRARGRVVAYKMSNEDLLAIISKNPTVMGYLLKQVYGQLSVKHSQLLSMAQSKRGILAPPAGRLRDDTRVLIITYAVILAVFVLTGLFAPAPENTNIFWMSLPLVFLVAHNLFTRRTLETLVLSVALSAGISHGGNFFQGFYDCVTEGITTKDTAQTILIMALMGAVTALLDAAGGISAFKRPVENRVKTARGALFAMLGLFALIFIDDYLNLLAAAFCTVKVMDRERVPREIPALIGTSATAVCSLIPISVWGAYLSGTIACSVPGNGGAVFLSSIKYNFASIVAVLIMVLLAAGIFPKSRGLKNAEKRVEQGGKLWPEGSEKYFLVNDDNAIYGRRRDLVMPIVVMVTGAVGFGMLRNDGHFGLDAGSGLALCLVFMFILYVSENLMTPEKFFNCVVSGIQSSILPILILLLTVCFSSSLFHLDMVNFLANSIPGTLARLNWMLPAALFLVFALFTLMLGSSWGMYGIGIPIATSLAVTFSMNLPLCIGAVCAAGIAGDNLIPYVSESALVASAVGCDPYINRRIRLQYWIPISIVCFAAYLVAGFIF